MSRLRYVVIVLVLFLLVDGDAYAALPEAQPANPPGVATGDSEEIRVAQRRRGRRKGKRRRNRRKKTKTEKEAEKAADALFDTPAPTPPEESGDSDESKEEDGEKEDAAAEAPILDLSGAGSDTDAARQELLSGESGDEGGKKESGGSFDFGGGVVLDLGGDEAVDFGGEFEGFDFEVEVESPERDRFDAAMEAMSDEEYAEASVEFRFFIEDASFAKYKQESEYQLAKSLYKMGFLDAALKRFQAILEQGPSHRRYRKAIEWLFFISRKVADETPVLAQLAQFRNVTFPKAYRNEYQYLLAKYLFIQAEHFEVERLEREKLARQKQSKSATFDFEGASGLMEGGAVDFSGFGESLDFGGGGGFDFGGSGDAAGGGGQSSGGGGFDFGGGGGSSGGGGFDFGSGAGNSGGDAALAEDAPVREALPQTAEQAIKQGLELVTQVEEDNRYYARAKYLEGLLNYLGGADQNAVNAFQEVVRVLNPRESDFLDPKLREMAFLSLARIHYGYKQFNRSAYYYDLIERDSENWLTALFEASWAYYRRGDYEKALGNLLTLHSPFFEREYFPESKLVKAIIYFEACRYAETRDIVDDFYHRYTKVMKEIARFAESKEAPEELYGRIVQMQEITEAESGGDDVTARLVSLALTDPGIRTARDVVQQTKDELQLWGEMGQEFRDSRVGREVYDQLKELEVQRAREAGEVTRKKFERELYNLKSLLAQALRIKIEVVSAEKDALRRKMRGEASQDEIVPAVARTVVGDEHLYWPYEGEYWRDELGTYELDFSMCRPLANR